MDVTPAPTPHTVVLRHHKERLSKCTLRGLEARPDFEFHTYLKARIESLEGFIILDMAGPELSKADADRGLFVIDGTWRYAEKMRRATPQADACVPRRIPGDFVTAYPRRQEDCPDPSRGLASIEAIYIAYAILGWPTGGLLDNYHWRDEFLATNRDAFAAIGHDVADIGHDTPEP